MSQYWNQRVGIPKHPLEFPRHPRPRRTMPTIPADESAGTWRMTEYTPLESQPPTLAALSPDDDDVTTRLTSCFY